MARMHSRKRGKSGSTKPVVKNIASWMTHKPKEVEMLVVKFAKEGLTASRIGIKLRDAYGIPDVKTLVGKTITKILEEKELTKELPEDLLALIQKSVLIRKHLEENHLDQPAKRGLTLTDSKIRRLAKYYIGTGKLPAGWKFDFKRATMYLD